MKRMYLRLRMPGVVLAHMELGILYTFALFSVGVYGVLLTGWARS